MSSPKIRYNLKGSCLLNGCHLRWAPLAQGHKDTRSPMPGLYNRVCRLERRCVQRLSKRHTPPEWGWDETASPRAPLGAPLNGCHQWECEGTRFPHTPLWSGVYVFRGFAAKNIHPTRMGWHAPSCVSSPFASGACSEVKPIEG